MHNDNLNQTGSLDSSFLDQDWRTVCRTTCDVENKEKIKWGFSGMSLTA